jgi:Copper transport outer membrane protein, MctB
LFDFRYHALSLVAVLVALGIGLLLGVAIGDSELVSSANRDVADGLRDDLREAGAESDELRDELRTRDEFGRQAYPVLASGQLPGQEVGLVFLGGDSRPIYDSVREALEPTGGELGYVAVVREPPDLGSLARRAEESRFEALEEDEDLLRPLAERLGRGLIVGSPFTRSQRSALLSSFSGELDAVDAIVVARSAVERDDESADAIAELEEGLVAGMRDTQLPVVGVETRETDPSQIRWYADRNMPSVDNVDTVSGRAALVFILAGNVEGTYGEKGTAEALLPSVVGDAPAP